MNETYEWHIVYRGTQATGADRVVADGTYRIQGDTLTLHRSTELAAIYSLHNLISATPTKIEEELR